jgi:hypothetical protein
VTVMTRTMWLADERRRRALAHLPHSEHLHGPRHRDGRLLTLDLGRDLGQRRSSVAAPPSAPRLRRDGRRGGPENEIPAMSVRSAVNDCRAQSGGETMRTRLATRIVIAAALLAVAAQPAAAATVE